MDTKIQPKDPLDEAIIKEMKTPQSMDAVAKKLGVARDTIHQRMKRLGIKPWGKPLAAGYVVKTNDGHFVSSLGEAKLDNFLFKWKITHEVHKPMQGTACIIDFWLNVYEVGLEYVGLVGNRDYDDRVKDKKDLYAHWNIPVVWVYPDTPLDGSLIDKIREALIKYHLRLNEDRRVLSGLKKVE